MQYMLGIDLGGTNIKAGLVDEHGGILCKDRIKTRAGRDSLAIISDIGQLAQQVISASGLPDTSIQAIGIGSPGTPDNMTGELIYANNLPFRHAPLRREIRRICRFSSTMMPMSPRWPNQLPAAPAAPAIP
jgi:glucokinase